jgi:adenosylhomocysteinase
MKNERLYSEIKKKYSPEKDFPCLSSQITEFELEKPLKGLRVLHSAPLYLNTIPKMLPLTFGGAEVVLTPTPGIPYDPIAMKLLLDCGFDCRETISNSEKFDLILDCVGAFAQLETRYGATELTRSGAGYYAESPKPCILVDDSRIKFLEDVLGTSDGLRRAFEQENISVKNQEVVLFGFGKVGKGVYLRLKSAGAKITVVDPDPKSAIGWDVTVVSPRDSQLVLSAVARANVVITATGLKGVLKEMDRGRLVRPKLLLMNMGAEDEYGPEIQEQEVFNRKRPANFILEEPTRLKYLDAIFALQNLAVLELFHGGLPPGVQKPSISSEQTILNEVMKNSELWTEVKDSGLSDLLLA